MTSDIDCASKALEALQELDDLFCSGEITISDFRKFRARIEPYITISERIAIEKNIKISNIVEFLKLAVSNHYVKSKNPDAIKLKNLIAEAIGRLSGKTHHEPQA